MRPEFEKARVLGDLVKKNIFKTERGVYVIVIYNWKGEIYFYKHLNGKLVECVNLSKKETKNNDSAAV